MSSLATVTSYHGAEPGRTRQLRAVLFDGEPWLFTDSHLDPRNPVVRITRASGEGRFFGPGMTCITIDFYEWEARMAACRFIRSLVPDGPRSAGRRAAAIEEFCKADPVVGTFVRFYEPRVVYYYQRAA